MQQQLKKHRFPALVVISCQDEDKFEGYFGIPMPADHGILEVDFKLPEFQLIQDGIRRVDLAVCHTMYEMNQGGMKYAFDEVLIKRGEKTYSMPVFQ